MKFAFLLSTTLAFAGTWTGRLMDATCLASTEAQETCAATVATNLFAIELPDYKVLTLNAKGSEKAALAVRKSPGSNLRVTVTGSLDGRTLKVESLELR